MEAVVRAPSGSLVGRFEAVADRCRVLATRPAVVVAAVWLAVARLILPATTADPDLFARVALGRLVATTGDVPTRDPFAWTERHAWIDHEWGSGVLFYHLSQLGGDWALNVAKLLLLLGTVALVAAAQRRASGADPVRIVWLLAAFACARFVWGSTIRAQTITYCCLALWLWALVRFERDGARWPLALLPPLMVLWANCHAGFVVGLGFQGVVLVSAVWKAPAGRRLATAWPLGAALAGSVAATLVNPYGLVYWRVVLEGVTMARPHIGEWAPLDVLGVEGVIPNVFLVLLVVGFALVPRLRDPSAIALVAISAVAGYRNLRLSAIFVLVAAVYGSEAMSAVFARLGALAGDRFERVKRAAAVLLACALPAIAVPVAASVARPRAFALDYAPYPVAALEWLRTHEPGGRLLVDFNLGSYALWRLHPRFQVPIDGRFEAVYTEATAALVADAFDVASPTQAASLDRLAPDYVLLKRTGRAFAGVARFGSDWHVVYQDPAFVLLGRTPPVGGVPAAPASVVPPVWAPLF
jgi:hypothetical protein